MKEPNDEQQDHNNTQLVDISYDWVNPQNMDEETVQNQEELWKKAFEKIRVSC